ncbi:hypothetical protein V1282_003846 [Nitrobacteraceae bacterium AZCC 2146]
MMDFWRRCRERQALVESDAADLIARYGEEAYDVARTRAIDEIRKTTVDANRPARHWERVYAEIRTRTNGGDRVDAATRYLES